MDTTITPVMEPITQQLSLEDYKAFFDTLGKDVISSATNEKGDIIFVNDRFVEISKFSRDELIGQNHRIIKSGFHPPEFYKNLWDTISSGVVWRGEIKNKAKDGSYYWVDTSIAPILGNDGKPIKYVSVRFLITKQKEAEEVLKKNLQDLTTLAAIVKYSTDAIIGKTTEGIVMSWNMGAEKMYGYTAEEMIGQSIVKIAPPDRHAEIAEILEKIKNGESIIHFETVRMKKSGELIDISLSISPLRNAAGEIVGASAIGRDITEKKLTERVIARQLEDQKALAAIVKYSEDAIIGETLSGTVTTWNPSAEIIYGYTATEMLGTSMSKLFSDDRKQDMQKILDNIKEGKSLTHLETVQMRKNGESVNISLSVSPIKNRAGDVISAAIIAQDITKSKKLQEAETKLLVVDALREANKELEAFSYSVSHDLRAPLRAIDGFAGILVRDYAEKLDDEGKHFIETIRSNTQQMGKLIDDLLAFSGLGHTAIKEEPINMTAMVNEIFNELKLTAPDRMIHFTCEELPQAYGDTTLLRQVWANLLSNAIKFTKKKESSSISVGAQNEKDRVIYYVKDNGAGFDMKYVDKLFRVFQRLHDATEFEGTGVGLAIVNRIITKHGGEVWAQAKVDQGATFYFSLSQKNVAIL